MIGVRTPVYFFLGVSLSRFGTPWVLRHAEGHSVVGVQL